MWQLFLISFSAVRQFLVNLELPAMPSVIVILLGIEFTPVLLLLG